MQPANKSRYCGVKAGGSDALPKWSDAEEALRQVTSNDVHRFLNYCLKLKYGVGGRHLKGTNKASALKADWKGFQGYYWRITRTKLSPEDREEINAVRYPYPSNEGRANNDSRGFAN